MDITFQTNYWFGFPESNSDIILNLTHWQYWWWFWFTYLLCLYYFIFLRLIRFRLLKFHPKIVTSYRAHGKWGDFIICLLPISWCVNILSNSNFILRMIEWQTESNLFTVRIRGRQWYWVYKFEIKTLINIIQIPKNLGHNYWNLFNNSNLNYSEDYINILQLKNNNQFLKNNINTFLKNQKNLNNKNFSINYNKNLSKNNIFSFNKLNLNEINNNVININSFVYNNNLVNNDLLYKYNNTTLFNINSQRNDNLNSNLFNLNFKYKDINRYLRYNYFSKIKPLKINFNKDNFLLKFNLNNNVNIEKNSPDNIYLVIKQKRFTPVKYLNFFNNKSLVLNNMSYLELTNENNFNKLILKKNLKVLKNKPQNFNNMYYRRLLRTRRILVLPTNINITLITNSFDVVHSWYIPGLGIKLDCIPGRSTHHTLHIDHAGFYYGQCAEICGRHHHHMPIRVCALPFEHFLIWWYHYGLPYFNATGTSRKKSIDSGIKQFNW